MVYRSVRKDRRGRGKEGVTGKSQLACSQRSRNQDLAVMSLKRKVYVVGVGMTKVSSCTQHLISSMNAACFLCSLRSQEDERTLTTQIWQRKQVYIIMYPDEL